MREDRKKNNIIEAICKNLSTNLQFYIYLSRYYCQNYYFGLDIVCNKMGNYKMMVWNCQIF